MNKKTITVLLALLLIAFPIFSRAGAVCFAACAIACCEVGVWAFAIPLGIAVGVTGCAGVCMVACAGGLFVPPACFANETTIIILEQGVEKAKSISSIQENDMVLTLQNQKPTWTRVMRNLKMEGLFKFLQITVQNLQDGSQKQVKVTPEHGVVLVKDNNEMIINFAENIAVGDKMISVDGKLMMVISVESLTMTEKFTLETADGTILASDLLMTTICAEEIGGHELPFASTIEDWRLRHIFRASSYNTSMI